MRRAFVPLAMSVLGLRPGPAAARAPPPAAAGEAPHGLWRTTAPASLRTAPSDTAPELLLLPTGAALWPISFDGAWSRVRGRAGAVDYDGFVHTTAITRTDR
ncbi:MAG: hypothetical protein ACOYOH_04515 [Paracraurococcus sp.]|jgi:hypothetical protein